MAAKKNKSDISKTRKQLAQRAASTRIAPERKAIAEPAGAISQPLTPENVEAEYRRAGEALAKHFHEIYALPYVCSAEVAIKVSKNKAIRKFAICIYVSRKVALGKLKPKQRIRKEYDGVPTDVIVRNRWSVLASTSPAGGDKIVVAGTTRSGTLGIDVVGGPGSGWDGLVQYLTCTHVISATNQISAPVTMNRDDGSLLGSANSSRKKDWDFDAVIDCALITPPADTFVTVGIPGGHAQPVMIRPPEAADVLPGRVVWKLGADTGLKKNGEILSIDAGSYGDELKLADGTIVKQQIRIRATGTEKFATNGDSGSILCVDNHAIGIIRAVHPSSGDVIACPLFEAAAQTRLNFGL